MSRGNNNKKRLLRAFTKRERLLEAGEIGPSSETDRHIGILVSATFSQSSRLRSSFKYSEEKEFIEEGEQILEQSIHSGFEASLHITNNREEALDFIGNRAITDVVFIGHGRLGSLQLDLGDMNWWHIARDIDHLKQGHIVQRHCGVRWQQINVALGTFAVTDMTKVIAPLGEVFSPCYPGDPEANALLVPVYQKPQLSYEEILAIATAKYED